MEGYVLIDNEIVRGGYLIKHQPFAIGDAMREDVQNIQLPLSEGSINSAFSHVSVQILAAAMRNHPLLYALGMGGIHTPLPTALKGMGWTTKLVPFFFRVIRPAAFLRNIRILRTTALRRLALDVAAATGVGQLGLGSIHAALTRHTSRQPQAQIVSRFGSWADEIWKQARSAYSLVALRDANELNNLYAEADRRPIRLRVTCAGQSVGWAVVFDTQLSRHKQFGDMRLGSIVDCFALRGHEAAVVEAATNHLASRGVDLIISNQSHIAWRDALRRQGYLTGRSNYGLAVSRGLVTALAPWDINVDRIHMTRGDGDGPIHL
ncbi:MAG: hypothetical protein ACRES9_07980 [Gammaproteobacteria bacterium]